MDNLTHTLVGLALARTRLGKGARTAPLALAVTANAPDLDIVPSFFVHGAQSLEHNFAYLADHRGITHAVAGILVQWWVWWAIFEWLERRRARRAAGAPSGPPPHSRSLSLAVLVGLASHPLLDLTNVYGVRPWLPFSRGWAYGDLFFIADPWLWILLSIPALLAGERTRNGNHAFALVAIAASIVLYRAGPLHVSQTARIAWPALVILIAVLRCSRIGVSRPRPVLAIGFALVGLYAGTLAIARAQAERQGLARIEALLDTGESIETHATTPDATRPLSWTMIAATGRRLVWQRIDLVRGADPPVVRPTLLDDPHVRAAAASEAGSVWRDFARFPIATIEDDRSDPATVVVVLRDGRYFDQDWCELRVRVPR